MFWSVPLFYILTSNVWLTSFWVSFPSSRAAAIFYCSSSDWISTYILSVALVCICLVGNSANHCFVLVPALRHLTAQVSRWSQLTQELRKRQLASWNAAASTLSGKTETKTSKPDLSDHSRLTPSHSESIQKSIKRQRPSWLKCRCLFKREFYSITTSMHHNCFSKPPLRKPPSDCLCRPLLGPASECLCRTVVVPP